ncbi:MAG: hypothetical protein LUC97_03325 [Clostridiales bacterium]|nr:hypothetical protein [Clostridiales bacterium]
MKKEYTKPEIQITKINSEEPTAAFVNGNYNSTVVRIADNSAENIINY